MGEVNKELTRGKRPSTFTGGFIIISCSRWPVTDVAMGKQGFVL